GEALKNPAKTEEFIDFINRSRGQDFTFKINRGGELKNLIVGSRVNPPVGQGSVGIGIFSVGIERQGFLASLKGGFNLAIEAVETIFKALYQLVRGAGEGSEVVQSVVGPIGIFSMASQANILGFVYFLQLVGLISVNLAVINIIPFPALDGGRAFFILIEKIKGSRLRPRAEKLANAVGISVLLALMVLITGRDIWRLL
ncbi:MAG: site-2 protease family protein, partial [Patescibacteria group bacterium]